ncbi:MAG: hypothetical protein ACTSPY_14030 [Candidatus Helarchaeota archaeon]
MENKNLPIWKSSLSEEAFNLTQIEYAAKLISTIDNRGWPHITFIVSNCAKTPTQIIWGQFTEGTSKENVRKNKKQGVFIMTPESPYKFIQAKIELENIKKEGEDVEYFSRMNFYRYNCYLNVHTVYYNKIIATTQVRNLSIGGIIKGMLVNIIGKGATKSKDHEIKLPKLGYNLFNGAIYPKFISYIDPSDGYPIIIPCFQMRAPDRSKLVFTLSQFKYDLQSIPENVNVAAYAMNFEPIMIHVNGIFTGFQKFRGIKYGIIEIEEVYNPMPPLAGVIYPKIQTRPKIEVFNL